jgi:hypothetical protein
LTRAFLLSENIPFPSADHCVLDWACSVAAWLINKQNKMTRVLNGFIFIVFGLKLKIGKFTYIQMVNFVMEAIKWKKRNSAWTNTFGRYGCSKQEQLPVRHAKKEG